jgi:hypothetical protein
MGLDEQVILKAPPGQKVPYYPQIEFLNAKIHDYGRPFLKIKCSTYTRIKGHDRLYRDVLHVEERVVKDIKLDPDTVTDAIVVALAEFHSKVRTSYLLYDANREEPSPYQTDEKIRIKAINNIKSFDDERNRF